MEQNQLCSTRKKDDEEVSREQLCQKQQKIKKTESSELLLIHSVNNMVMDSKHSFRGRRLSEGKLKDIEKIVRRDEKW
jgi:hypothetical protein